ncbi:MAG: hypothetical protein MUF10_13390 [Thermoanaerobaculaceae bacterium]|nr:hypothetical protein [Thermoanaerobaculaceae bacterium]
MPRSCAARIFPVVLALTATMIPTLLQAQQDGLSPSARFEKGFALLKEKGYTLLAEQTTEGEKPQREKITSYSDLVLLVNTQQPVTFFIVHKETDKETRIASLKPAELSSKALGAWLWYKLCAAADLMDSCRAAGVIA